MVLSVLNITLYSGLVMWLGLGISQAHSSNALDTEDNEVWVEKPQQSLGIHSSMAVVFGCQAFLPTLLSLSLLPYPSLCSLSRGSQYLAAFTFNIVPLRWILINSFSSTAVRNPILQALNHWPAEKVGELQILRSPLLNPGSYWGKGALMFCWQSYFSLSLSLHLLRCLRVFRNMFFFFSPTLFWCCCQAPPHACNH